MSIEKYQEIKELFDAQSLWFRVNDAFYQNTDNIIYKEYVLNEDSFIRIYHRPNFESVTLHRREYNENNNYFWAAYPIVKIYDELPIELKKIIIYNLDLFT